MEIKNYLEDIVNEKFEKLHHKENICPCNRCRADIVAYTMNQLPSKYVVTHRGHIYTKIEQLKIQYKADVIMALEKAIKIVSKKPRHEA